MITLEPDQKAIERANGYRQMMSSWAWKDFENSLKEMRAAALERCITASTMEHVQLQRGIVKCLDSIESGISQILEGI